MSLQFALVSRSLAPFGGGGIGEYVDTTARVLSVVGDVTIFTPAAHRERYEQLRAVGDPEALLAPAAEYVFVEDDEEPSSFYSEIHRYSAAVLDAITVRYPGGGPDLIEVSDYLGEGFVLAQAVATGDPRVSQSLLAVRLHTTAEICAVLDGHLDQTDFETRVVGAMERYTLRHADVLLWPGGDVLGLYERFYGRDNLAPAELIRNPLLSAPLLDDPAPPESPDEPLKLLYLGRLERRKGVQNLLRALPALGHQNWRLTLLGSDTDTGPLGSSVRGQLELMAAGDRRITFLDHVGREQLGSVISAHDVVVLPSLWECWPYVALEAMRHNRPVLATPTGGFTELIVDGENGWLTRDTTATSLLEALERRFEDRDATAAPRRRNAPRATVAALTDPGEVADRYAALLAGKRRETRADRPSSPFVSVIVPYFRMSEFVEETIRSVAAQTYPSLEIILINDGSFQHEDSILFELAARYPIAVLTQANSGLGAARNFGVSQARGRYVLPLDADNVIEPSFVARCVDVLEAHTRVAYVTTWSRYIDEEGAPYEEVGPGYQPLGNESELILLDNVAGDAAAVIRRRIFDLGFRYSTDLTSYEDWHLYLELHRRGHYGLVIPERLLGYRVRSDSMIRDVGLPRTRRLFGEIQAHMREQEVEWTSRNA